VVGGADGDMLETHAEALDLGAQVRVIGDHHGNIDRQLAALPAPQQFHQRVIVLRDQDRHALPVDGVGHAPVHREGPPHLFVECRPQRLSRDIETRRLEFQAQEEAPAFRIGGMLVQLSDVGTVLEQEGGNGGNDAPTVGTGDQQTGGGIGFGGHDGGKTGSRR
jgi:hypothetical protein